jgi:PKD repeat protein/cold shock CspA family protein
VVRSSVDNFQSNLPFTSTSKFVRNSNNIAHYKADTTSAISLNFFVNDQKLNDLRDGNKVTFRIYAWNAETIAGSLNIDSLFILADSTKMNIEGFAAVGVSANSAVKDEFAFTNWGTGGIDNDTILANQTGAINLNKYYQFKSVVFKRKMVNLDSISFVVSRNLTGVKSFSVRSSADNYASDLAIKTSYTGASVTGNQVFIKADTTSSFTVITTLNSNKFKSLREDKEITFRIYAWNAENANGTFEIDSLRLLGQASSIENVDNFMDYTDCIKMFTKDQAALMTAILSAPNSIRYDLHQEANLKSTGTFELVTPACTPKPYFTISNSKICSGGLVTFKDLSWNTGVTSRTWTFQDGNPSTSTDVSPKVFFSTPGYKKVTLKVKNSAGEDSLVLTNAIYVTGDQAQIANSFAENFNTGISNDWLIENQEDNYAKFATGTGRWGSKGIKLNVYKDVTNATPLEEDNYFYFQRLRNTKDAIISPSINFKTLTESSLHFDYAYATSSYYDSLITEKIEVSYSTNCGKTWTPIHSIVYIDTLADAKSVSSDLITAGIYGGREFIPTSDEMWKTAVVNLKDIEKDPEEDNVRIKIEFVASSSSNNLFLDNINLFATVGIEENPLNTMNFAIVPNPTSNDKGINIEFKANEKAVSFELIDLQGKVIAKETNSNSNGTVTHTLKLANQLNAGYYTLRISQGEFVTNKKVIIQ